MLSISRFNLRALVLIILIIIVLFTAAFFNLDHRYSYRLPRPEQLRLPDIQSLKPDFLGGQKRPPPSLDEHFRGNPEAAVPGSIESAISAADVQPHPIDELVRRADKDFEALLSRQTYGIHEAAEAYRKRRGRHPPPGYDKWVAFAEEVNATTIEDLFDQIYNDLGPFWGTPVDHLRASVDAWPVVISVRNGAVRQRTDRERDHTNAWENMVSQVAPLLPDLDMAMNEMDESRIFATWDTVAHYMNVATERQKQNPSLSMSDMISEYPRLPPPEYDPDRFHHSFLRSTPIWSLVAAACPQASPGRRLPSEQNMQWSPWFPDGWPDVSHKGYVSNFTIATDPCSQPHVRGLHGTFIEPISISTSQQLFPIFGGSKLPQNNDILLPPSDFWTAPDTTHDELRMPWSKKADTVFWRGDATGGRNRMPTWARFHRHRFVGAANATALVAAQAFHAHGAYPGYFPELPPDTWILNFQLPNTDHYKITALSNGHLGAWMNQHSDVAFTNLVCFPSEGWGPGCSYTGSFYRPSNWVNMRDHFNYKYLPDIDGNDGGTPRFPAALRSTSVPMKASMYRTWFSSRVMPWKHFVPMDMTYKDLWGIMEYFIGYDDAAVTAPSNPLAQFNGFQRAPNPKDLPTSTDPTTPKTPAEKDALKRQKIYDAEQDAVRAFHGREWGNVRLPPDEAASIHSLLSHGHSITTTRPSADEAARLRQRVADQAAKLRERAPKVVNPHDEVGAWIAEGGARWAARTLRKEDALVYVYRLLLEYARVSSEGRDRMGFVADLKAGGADMA